MDGAGFLLTIFTDLKTKQNNIKTEAPLWCRLQIWLGSSVAVTGGVGQWLQL